MRKIFEKCFILVALLHTGIIPDFLPGIQDGLEHNIMCFYSYDLSVGLLDDPDNKYHPLFL